ncbi:MAG: diphosphomevalonate decarboxylase, partial [Bacteroidota bacterium]
LFQKRKDIGNAVQKPLHLTIHTSNSFPHSAGIASSASSMGALALCLCSLEDQLFGTLKEDAAFRQKASYVARLGSGSASRSIYAYMGAWGSTSDIEGSSDLYAVGFESPLHEVFKTFHDDILIISKGEKSVSSTAGHALMDDNIYADNRYMQAKRNLQNLLPALRKGDLEMFGKITEQEALTLHALMMSSNPPYILMQPNSLAAIQKVQRFRADTGHPLYFSLDAGPNLHLLYPDEIKTTVQAFIQSELVQLCEGGQIIQDQVGLGPLEIAPEVE